MRKIFAILAVAAVAVGCNNHRTVISGDVLGIEDGMMLNGGGNNMLVLFAEALNCSQDGPVVRFCTAGGEEHPVGLCTQSSGN